MRKFDIIYDGFEMEFRFIQSENQTYFILKGDNGIGGFWKTTKQAIFRKSWEKESTEQ